VFASYAKDMKKTLFILIVVALLGILAAAVSPSPQNSVATTTKSTSTTTQTPTTSTTNTSSSATTATPTPTATPTTTTTTTSSSQYKDGTYNGSTSSNRFDDIQVQVVISGGKITNITTPVLNGDSGRSVAINSYAVPQLKNQVMSAQSATIDGVSGASYTTDAYVTSLQSALDQAKA